MLESFIWEPLSLPDSSKRKENIHFMFMYWTLTAVDREYVEGKGQPKTHNEHIQTRLLHGSLKMLVWTIVCYINFLPMSYFSKHCHDVTIKYIRDTRSCFLKVLNENHLISFLERLSFLFPSFNDLKFLSYF